MANTESLTSIPERRANLCSRLLFTWYTPLTSVQINTASDVWKTPKEDSSLVQTTLLEERLEYQKKLNTSPQRQLLFALVRTRGWEWLLCSFLKLTGMYSNIFNLSFSHPLFAVCVCVCFFVLTFLSSIFRLFVHSFVRSFFNVLTFVLCSSFVLFYSSTSPSSLFIHRRNRAVRSSRSSQPAHQLVGRTSRHTPARHLPVNTLWYPSRHHDLSNVRHGLLRKPHVPCGSHKKNCIHGSGFAQDHA